VVWALWLAVARFRAAEPGEEFRGRTMRCPYVWAERIKFLLKRISVHDWQQSGPYRM